MARRAALIFCTLFIAACGRAGTPAPQSAPAVADAHAGVAPQAGPPPPPAAVSPELIQVLPIFDTHIHYSIGAWERYDPAQIAAIMTRANVVGGLVSSSPDDGTVMLQANDPGRVRPILRPYHGDVNSANWSDDPYILTYLEERLKARDYLGIGEFHVTSVAQADSAVVREVVRMATGRGMFVQVHGSAEVIRRIIANEPQARVFWAHMGMSDPPQVVGKLLDDVPRAWTDTSYREGEIAPGGVLDRAWGELLVRHSDRILVGSDTWVPGRWDSYEQIMAAHRAYLELLPRQAAENIAWRNAARLFGTR